MAQGAASPFTVLTHTPGNPQLPTLPNPNDPKTGLDDDFSSIAGIDAPRFEETHLAINSAAPGVAKGFAQTYFNQIGVAPNPIDFGNITAEKTRVVNLHNTNRTPCQVTAVDLSAVSGVVLDSPGLPITIEPFSSAQFTFTAALLGDTSFDANAIFTTDCGNLTLRMIGRRVIIISVFPQRAITEQLKFLTDNIISEDGSEQTMSLRLAPRSSVSMELRYTDILERAVLQNVLLGAIYLPVGAQQWWQSRTLTAAALTTDLVIQVSTEFMEIEIGGTVQFALADRSTLEAEVLSFTASDITLTQAIGTALPADTNCMMIKFGFINPKVVLGDYPVELQNFNLKFELNDYASIPEVDPAYFDSHHIDGLPIIKDCLFIDGKSRKGGIVSNQSRLDGQTGAIRQSRTEAISRPNQPILAHCKSLADQHAWRKFLHFLRGSWGTFYVPTGTNDMILQADFSLGSNILTVLNMGYTTLIDGTAPRRDVRVTIAGVNYYRRIVSSIDNGVTEDLTLDSAIPGAGTIAIADMLISWLTLSRIVADTATFKHQFRGISELRFATRGVIDGV